MKWNHVFVLMIVLALLIHVKYGYRGLYSSAFKKHTNVKTSHYDEVIETRQTVHVNTVPSLKGVKTKIVQLIPPNNIEAVQLRHIEVETNEMAAFCKSLLVNNTLSLSDIVGPNSQSFQWDFASLAVNISRCERSKVVGGDLGWVFLDQIGKGNSDDLLASLAQEASMLQKGV